MIARQAGQDRRQDTIAWAGLRSRGSGAGVRLLQALTRVLVAVYLGSTLFRAHHETGSLYDGWIGNLGYGGCTLLCVWLAKREHRSSEVDSPVRNHHAPERPMLVEDLRDAIEQDQLVLHFQPIVDVWSRRVIGAEALVRWQHPTRGLLDPAAFLGHLEQSGLGPLATDVINKALAQQAHWAGDGLHLRVSVNLSAANLRDTHLVNTVEEALSRHGVSPSNLVLEITEDSFMVDPTQSMSVLDDLRALGVELSIDDYGTGFSSLTYLHQLPVSELKLDRSFLRGVPDDDRSVAIIRSTIELAHTLGLRVVSEGVETDEAVGLLRDLGCDLVQGFLLGRPVPADRLALSPPASAAA